MQNNNTTSSTTTGIYLLNAIAYCAPFVAVLLLVLAFVADAGATLINLLISEPFDTVIYTAKKFYWELLNRIVTDPYFYIGIPLIFLLQILLPVRRDQPIFGASTRTDMVFMLAMVFFYATITPVFYAFLRLIYNDVFGFLDLDFQLDLPTWTQLLLGYLAIDFLGWFHHLVRHKVPVFWEFHAVHHSQTEMNPFTNERVHPFDWFTANIIKFIPAMFFTESLQIILQYIVIHRFLDHLTHSNVKTNLGWFRYIFVTPQSHRVHHSSIRGHFDTNFGVSLSIWDHLFGTQYRDYDVYPETGIPDTEYPLENDRHLKRIVLSIVQQMVYPFFRVWQRTRALAKGARSA